MLFCLILITPFEIGTVNITEGNRGHLAKKVEEVGFELLSIDLTTESVLPSPL